MLLPRAFLAVEYLDSNLKLLQMSRIDHPDHLKARLLVPKLNADRISSRQRMLYSGELRTVTADVLRLHLLEKWAAIAGHSEYANEKIALDPGFRLGGHSWLCLDNVA